jgi:hypothetical protein
MAIPAARRTQIFRAVNIAKKKRDNPRAAKYEASALATARRSRSTFPGS